MKILFVMDPGIRIPVTGYGGIERIIEMLALEHAKNGHEVHLLVTEGSKIKGCTVHGYGKAGFPPNKWNARKAIPTAWKFLWKHRNDFDLIHNFGRLIYLLPVLNYPVKKIMSYQREITKRNIKWINALPNKNLIFTGCSQNLINRNRLPANWETIYNACDFAKYTLQQTVLPNAPLIFLGRIEKIKGCHTAIKVAKATGNTLIIAGNISPLPEEKEYYETQIAPHIDGKQIQYIGTVNDAQKNEWLGKSKALLFPIEWNEPFGIVMIEAMACGTPVIAFNHGSVKEIVTHGVTGYKVNSETEMIDAVHKLSSVSRSACKEQAMERFDVSVIAKQYLHIICETRKTILILTTHQPAANPRAFKEYETLKDKGYAVKYLYGYNAQWSHKIDEAKFKDGLLNRQDFIALGGNPHQHFVQYFISRVLYRIFRVGAIFNTFCKQMSSARVAFALWNNAVKHPAHLYIAHYLGALPAANRAAKKHKASLLFDAEDFHRGEQSYYKQQVKNTVSVEDRLLPKVDAITTASPQITAAYKKYYPNKNIITINNVFSKKYLQPILPANTSTLKLFWFSQNIGTNRGLEIFIQALNLLPDAEVTLTIMGNNRSEPYRKQLLGLSHQPHKIIFRSTVAPEQIFTIAAQYDIGLAGEIPNCYNKEICLSNKIFTYLLAGNAILASDMQGQKEFMEQHPGIGFTYKYDDASDLARHIKNLYCNKKLLQSCKEAAHKLAATQLNWEAEESQWLAHTTALLDKKQNIKHSVNLFECTIH